MPMINSVRIEHGLAAEAVAVVAENDAADRPRQEADEECAIGQ